MLAEALAKGLITAGQPLKKLKANPQIVQTLSDYATEMDKILQLPFEVVEVAKQDIEASLALRQSYGLFVNDSINFASATRSGVIDIVSHDSDFQRAPIIHLWMPTDL
ncbi:MAG: type II toxin-antitoxin system VapC family toxin [Blastocatellia bacterium]